MTCPAWRCFGIGPRPGLQLLLLPRKAWSIPTSCHFLPFPGYRTGCSWARWKEGRKELTKGAPKALLMLFSFLL